MSFGQQSFQLPLQQEVRVIDAIPHLDVVFQRHGLNGEGIGFAFLFSPLFTVSLSSVPPALYSHGSAVLGAIQQVAGAAGVALFVAIMTARSAAIGASGADPAEALAGGIRSAFIVGAIISLGAVVASLFVRRPAAQPAASTGH